MCFGVAFQRCPHPERHDRDPVFGADAHDFGDFLGIARQRIQIISYGEERPFSIGSGESSWRLNRRSHFVIVAR